jgi:hypothetical protein
MKPFPVVPLSLFSIGLALFASSGRADDQANPPAPTPAVPASPQVTPGEGAQPTPTPMPRHKRMRPGYALEELTEKLGLTAEQQKTVGAAIDSGRSQAKALRGDDSLSKDDKHEKMMEIMKATHDQIRADLTPDQQKIFDTMPAGGGKPKNTENN